MYPDLFKGKVGIGHLRNEICPFCESGKKFKKCKCYEAQTILISEILKPPKTKEQIEEETKSEHEKEIKEVFNNSKGIEVKPNNYDDSDSSNEG